MDPSRDHPFPLLSKAFETDELRMYFARDQEVAKCKRLSRLAKLLLEWRLRRII